MSQYRDHAAEYAACSRARARRARAPINRKPPPLCVRFGADNGNAKLRDIDVMLIRLLDLFGFERGWLATMFGADKVTIGRIIHRDSWRHV